jgi:hypothetical protein
MILPLPTTFKWIPLLFLVLLGYFAIASSVYAQESVACDPPAFSPVDCPPTSSGEEVINNDGDEAEINNDGTDINIDDDVGNIEEQIPSVLPFP